MQFSSLIGLCLLLAGSAACAQPRAEHNLSFSRLPGRWEEGLPLGNGLLGCLVWQKDGRLRLSLDRADLWDTRPMAGLDRPEFNYRWVAAQVAKGEYGLVQEYFDAPYEREAGPTKLPGAALEFRLKGIAQMPAKLDLGNGLAIVGSVNKGYVVHTFVHARRREGWFRLRDGRGGAIEPELAPPPYAGDTTEAAGGSVRGDALARLGYRVGTVTKTADNILVYRQLCRNGFYYEVAVAWRQTDDGMEGVWSISSHFPQKTTGETAEKTVRQALKRGFDRSLEESRRGWAAYWGKSSVQLPDSTLERQYYRELYKFGCVARADAPMISLQAVWTADNGRLPPWKGDLHHDLNTQMSYWPAYAANRLDEASGYLRHLESNDAAHRAYTRRYFGNEGLNVPGVETLLGEPMGGWIQYACSPTTSAWLAQHFYWHWRYSADRRFLKHHAWPWLRDAATHLEAITVADESGRRVLPLSSSPEINDNRINAWFTNTWTNYDLALTRFVFEKTAELARELNRPADAAHWEKRLSELPALAVDVNDALTVAPGIPLPASHRHFSHLMAIYPLGLPVGKAGIDASLAQLDSLGTREWTGYSFAWLACLRARAGDGDGAREALRIFAEAFVSANSFHLNGDQSGKGYSAHTYRPFTLEGNFAFAAGIQEMLLQSGEGRIAIFPAAPEAWRDVSFEQLRAEGGVLVSAARRNGKLAEIRLRATRDTDLLLLGAALPGTPEEQSRTLRLRGARLDGYDRQAEARVVRMKAGGELWYRADGH